MHWNIYKGRFGFVNRTRTLPWGAGPVLTLGKPCAGRTRTEAAGSTEDTMMKDMMNKGMMTMDEKGLLLAKLLDGTVAPALHLSWWFNEHKKLFVRMQNVQNETAMAWVKE